MSKNWNAFHNSFFNHIHQSWSPPSWTIRQQKEEILFNSLEYKICVFADVLGYDHYSKKRSNFSRPINVYIFGLQIFFFVSKWRSAPSQQFIVFFISYRSRTRMLPVCCVLLSIPHTNNDEIERLGASTSCQFFLPLVKTVETLENH